MRFAHLLTLATSLCVLLTNASAQTYPDRPIRLVVGFPAGGGADVYARLLSRHMEQTLGQPVVVENKPGAGATIAAEYVARSKPDGYTLLMGATSEIAAYPVVRPSVVRYRVPQDFSFVGLAFEAPAGIIAGSESQINTFEDLVVASKKREVRLAYSGAGGPSQLMLELIKARAKIQVTGVTFAGIASSVPDILAGRIDGWLGNFGGVKSHIDVGKMKLIVLMDEGRNPNYPGVKTLKEQGIDINGSGFFGIVAPAGLPTPVVQKLSHALSEALRDPHVVTSALPTGAMVKDLPMNRFRDYVTTQSRWYKDGMATIPDVEKVLNP